MTAYEKLLSAQADLKTPKSQRNEFGGFNYRSCEDILEGLKPLLVKLKAVLTISDEIVLIGARYYIKATAAFRDVETDEVITACAYAREPDTTNTGQAAG